MFRGTSELRFHFPVSSKFFMLTDSGPSIENKLRDARPPLTLGASEPALAQQVDKKGV
jgi:hypothetical protein